MVMVDGQTSPDPERQANWIEEGIKNWAGVHKYLIISRDHRKHTGLPMRCGMGP